MTSADPAPRGVVPDVTLAQLGWNSHFSSQLSDEDCRYQPARVMSVHRGMVTVMVEGTEESLSSIPAVSCGPEDRPTVGDWVLVEPESRSLLRILDRTSLVKRPAPGDGRRVQLIAANVDTLFIVTSCDQDFNVARIERYLVLAREINVCPVVVLTKADLSSDPDQFVAAARAVQPHLQVELVNGRMPTSAARLAAYSGFGQTIALVGSSGVGKSTLINTLRGSDSIATQAVREGDGKGLHTTTVRQMHRLGNGPAGGGWLIDTPGMRELQMSEVSSGVVEVFDDVSAMTLQCRFTNCTHGDEPDCAVQVAISEGKLTADRVARWHKLTSENDLNTGIAAVRRARAPKRSRRK